MGLVKLALSNFYGVVFALFIVVLFDFATATECVTVVPFGGVLGGVRVAAGDINGDGASDLVLGAGQGSTRVNIMSGRDFALLDDFSGISPFSASGVFVG